MYINKAQLYGNVTREPEAKALPNGGSVVNFGLATNRQYKDKNGEKKEETQFHNVVAFGKTAEVIAQYVKKGDGLYVEGRLQTRSWESDGAKRYQTEVVVENFQFGTKAGARKESAPEPSPAPASAPVKYPDEEINPEDIPF